MLEVSVQESDWNLAIIESLSPSKHIPRNKSISVYGQDECPSLRLDEERSSLPVMSSINGESSGMIGERSIIVPTRDLREKSPFRKDTYFQEVDRVKDLQKSFNYPANPAYLNTRNHKKLRYLSDFCRENKIPMSNNEELIMNLDLSKMQHSLWKDTVQSIYDAPQALLGKAEAGDTIGDAKTDEEELVDLFKHFDKKGFTVEEIEDILNRRKEYKGREILRMALRRFARRGSVKPKPVLDDENTLLSMFKSLARDKERRHKAR